MPKSDSSSSTSDDDAVEHLQFKLVLLGGEAVGKTAIVKRLVHGSHSPSYTSTIGADFYRTQVALGNGLHITLQLWDLGSHVSSLQMAANYLHGCDAVLTVYDITNQQTFTHIEKWLQLLQQIFQETILPYVAIVANKVDDEAVGAAVATDLQGKLAELQGRYGYCVSAKTGMNIVSTFRQIAADLAGVVLDQDNTAANKVGAAGLSAASNESVGQIQATSAQNYGSAMRPVQKPSCWCFRATELSCTDSQVPYSEKIDAAVATNRAKTPIQHHKQQQQQQQQQHFTAGWLSSFGACWHCSCCNARGLLKESNLGRHISPAETGIA